MVGAELLPTSSILAAVDGFALVDTWVLASLDVAHAAGVLHEHDLLAARLCHHLLTWLHHHGLACLHHHGLAWLLLHHRWLAWLLLHHHRLSWLLHCYLLAWLHHHRLSWLLSYLLGHHLVIWHLLHLDLLSSSCVCVRVGHRLTVGV